jgi:hypothetical protein
MSASQKIVLKKLTAHNTIWHPESTLVFKSQKDRLVIGRYIDDELIPLDDEAMTLCETWKFKPDESLLGGDEEETEKVDEYPEDEDEDENEDKNEEPKKIEKTVSSNVSSKDVSIRVLTQSFTDQLYTAFDLLTQEKISLTSQLEEKVETLADLQKKYDDIKKKFDTMKSLFN